MFYLLVFLTTFSVLILLALIIGFCWQAKNDPIPQEDYRDHFKGDWIKAECRANNVDNPLQLIFKRDGI